MTSPIASQDIVVAATEWLLDKPDTVAAVTTFNIEGRIFPGIFGYQMWLTGGGIEGTSGTAVVIASEGGWTAANPHNTLRFPRLQLNVWVDPLRDGGRNTASPGEALARANGVYEVFDRHLHHVAGADMRWGQLRVVSCVRMTEPVVTVIPDGIVRLQAYYAVTQG